MSIDELRTKIAPVLRRYDVRHAAVFGSVARHEETPTSDVDVMVDFASPVGLIAYSRLGNELEAALGRPVDLLTPASINEHLRPYVSQDLVTVYEG